VDTAGTPSTARVTYHPTSSSEAARDLDRARLSAIAGFLQRANPHASLNARLEIVDHGSHVTVVGFVRTGR
jgi:hypothetical protein